MISEFVLFVWLAGAPYALAPGFETSTACSDTGEAVVAEIQSRSDERDGNPAIIWACLPQARVFDAAWTAAEMGEEG
tara:strand:+ start:463 stop:693 length:231 start_codon:yes stop_codon:yes gene_type:complete